MPMPWTWGPLNPAGQDPQRKPGEVLMQRTPMWHGFTEHCAQKTRVKLDRGSRWRSKCEVLAAVCSLYIQFFRYTLFVHLIHICAVAPVALHAIRTRPTLHPLRCHYALHPQVARVGHARRTELDPPHTWKQSKSIRQLSSEVEGGVSVRLSRQPHSPQASHSITVFFKNSISLICKTSVEWKLNSALCF